MNMQTTIGKPETLEALLPSAGPKHTIPESPGIPAGWTRHVYDHSEIIEWSALNGTCSQGWGHFYRCTVTGALRLWGCEHVPFNHGVN